MEKQTDESEKQERSTKKQPSMEETTGDGIASYGVLLAWLIVALLLAAALAYLMIHPFMLRISKPLGQSAMLGFPSANRPGVQGLVFHAGTVRSIPQGAFTSGQLDQSAE